MGKMGMGLKFQMEMGMKSLKWEGSGTENLFPHISSMERYVAYRSTGACE